MSVPPTVTFNAVAASSISPRPILYVSDFNIINITIACNRSDGEYGHLHDKKNFPWGTCLGRVDTSNTDHLQCLMLRRGKWGGGVKRSLITGLG